MTPDELTAHFQDDAMNFAPWRTRHVVDGRAYGGEVDYSQDDRWRDGMTIWKPAGRILEFGCFEGGHTALLAAQPGVISVHAVDGRDYLVDRTARAAQALGLTNVTVSQCNADEPAAVEALGPFDGVYCTGLLYHLMEPWKFLAALRKITGTLFLSTHYAAKPTTTRNGYDVMLWREHGYLDALSGMRDHSVWPTYEALNRMIEDAGFSVMSARKYPAWSAQVHSKTFPLANLLCEARRW